MEKLGKTTGRGRGYNAASNTKIKAVHRSFCRHAAMSVGRKIALLKGIDSEAEGGQSGTAAASFH
jgi:hypothetical protein